MIWSKCPGHVKSDGPGGLNTCPICHPPRTLADDGAALRATLDDLGRDLAAAMRLPQIVEWLTAHLPKGCK